MSQVKNSWVDFKEIKARVSIVQILENYGIFETLERSGDRLSGVCPIHGGSNKTHFRVSIAKNCWNCFGQCQRGGNIIDLVSCKENVSFRDAALLIQEWFGNNSPSRASAEKPRFDTSRIQEPSRSVAPQKNKEDASDDSSTGSSEIAKNSALSFELSNLDPAHPYLAERGLTEKTIATFGLGYCSKGLLRGHIAIPIHNTEGSTVAYAGRLVDTSGKKKSKYKFPKDFRKSLEVFNYHRAMASEQEVPLVVVEGFFDAMMLHQAGYEKVVALMGSSLSERQEYLIRRLCESDRRIILFFDGDEAGQKGQAEAQARFSAGLFVNAIRLEDGKSQPGGIPPNELRAILPFPKESPHE